MIGKSQEMIARYSSGKIKGCFQEALTHEFNQGATAVEYALCCALIAGVICVWQ